MLKGGVALVEKKESSKKKRKAPAVEKKPAEEPASGGIGGDVGAKPNKSYEELFPAEVKRQQEAKGRTAAWGTNYREAPEILHGYTKAIDKSGPLSAEQRLDMRSASKCAFLSSRFRLSHTLRA